MIRATSGGVQHHSSQVMAMLLDMAVVPPASGLNGCEPAKAHTVTPVIERPMRSALEGASFTADTSSVVDEKSFAFLSLPADIRIIIYEFLFLPPNNSFLRRVVIRRQWEGQSLSQSQRETLTYERSYDAIPAPHFPCLLCGLLYTCRQVYNETLPYLYSNTVFSLADNNGLFPLFIKRLSDTPRNCITYLHLVTPEPLKWGEAAPRLLSSTSKFHWTVTCAQVVRCCPKVKILEVEWTSLMCAIICEVSRRINQGTETREEKGLDLTDLVTVVLKPLVKLEIRYGINVKHLSCDEVREAQMLQIIDVPWQKLLAEERRSVAEGEAERWSLIEMEEDRPPIYDEDFELVEAI